MAGFVRANGWALAAFLLLVGMAAGQEAGYAVGDRVVTVKRADIKKGSETLVSAEPGTELEVTAVKGDFLGVTLARPDAEPINGWIYAPNVKRIDAAPPAAEAPAEPAPAPEAATEPAEPAMTELAPIEPAAKPAEPSAEPAVEPSTEPSPEPAEEPSPEAMADPFAEPAGAPAAEPADSGSPAVNMPLPLPASPGLELPQVAPLDLDSLMAPAIDAPTLDEPGMEPAQPDEPPVWTKIVLDGDPIPAPVWSDLADQFRLASPPAPLNGLNLESKALAAAHVTPQALEAAYGPPDEVRPPARGRKGATYHVYGPLFLGVLPDQTEFSQVKAGGLLWESGFRAMAELAAQDAGRFDQMKEAYDLLLDAVKAADEENIAAAAGYLEQAIALAPEDGRGYRWRALVLARQGEFDRAWADVNRAMELGPESAGLYSDRGVLQEVRGDREQALADYDKALQLDPQCVPALRNRAALHAAAGDRDKALADLARAVEIAPADPATYRARADVYNAAGDQDAASTDAQKAAELESSGGGGNVF